MRATAVPYAEVKARLLADPATKAAYAALEPAVQIARLRIEAGLTQAQLAGRAGTKQPSSARLEREQTQPAFEFRRKLGAALGTPGAPERRYRHGGWPGRSAD